MNPKIELVGVVTGYGNVDERQATENASYLLQLAGRPDIPVIRGAKGPFSGELVDYYPEIHGPEGLGPIRPPENIVTNVRDYSEVFDIIRRYKNDLTIVDVGRSTLLATSFILAGEDFVNQALWNRIPVYIAYSLSSTIASSRTPLTPYLHNKR